MGVDGLTPFESEVVDSVLWQLEGFWAGRVSQRATARILRATLRRIKPLSIARSADAASAMDRGLTNAVADDHAIPLATVVAELLPKGSMSRKELERVLIRRLVCVQVTHREHNETLKAAGLARRMPASWDGSDIFARYKAAGIALLPQS